MYFFNKLFERFSRFFRYLISNDFIMSHKYQNKNQVTNSNTVLSLLKNKDFYPTYIVDVGCGYGQWTKKLLNTYPNSQYLLFDADTNNNLHLSKLKSKYKNIDYKICLLTDNDEIYTFYNMGYGSSIFEEQTNHLRKKEKIKSTTLFNELPRELNNYKNNLIKIDVQGAELKVIDGLKNYLNNFEVIILEVSIHNYNKDSPLFDKVINFMIKKGYRLYDIFDLKRLGNKKSYLLQFDCIFVRYNSNLLDVKF